MKLTINNVSKAYGSNKALQHFTADLEPGIYALLGPNGSGKSTLMNIITDNLKSDEGEILFSDGGEAENILKMGVRFREKLGFMPQYPGMYPNFSIERFMWYMATLKDVGSHLKGRAKREYIKNEIQNILKAVELDDIPVRRISFGVGVEKTFPIHSPKVADIKVIRKGKVRRAKLYYLRERTGKSAKVKEVK